MNLSTAESMQESLERALVRAARADDQELAHWVRREGGRFLFLLHGLVRTAQLHDINNQAYERPAEGTAQSLTELLQALGTLHIVFVEDQAYVNDFRISTNVNGQQILTSLGMDLSGHGVGGMTFHHPVSTHGLKRLASSLASRPASQAPREALSASLADIRGLVMQGPYRFRMSEGDATAQRSFETVASRVDTVISEALANLADGRVPHPLPVRRVVIDLVEAIRREPTRALTVNYTHRHLPAGRRHLFAVCALSLAIGERLGLSDATLSDLGVAAILHDVGFAGGQGAEHSRQGLRTMARQRGFHEAKIRRLLATIEHHRPYRSDLDPFTRIIQVADEWDARLSLRPSRPLPPSPSTLLGQMWAAGEERYDATALSTLGALVGRFPPGTIVDLKDGRRGVVISGGRDTYRFAVPVVAIVAHKDGAPLTEVYTVDTAEGEKRRPFERVMEPAQLKGDVQSLWDAAFGGAFTPERWDGDWPLRHPDDPDSVLQAEPAPVDTAALVAEPIEGPPAPATEAYEARPSVPKPARGAPEEIIPEEVIPEAGMPRAAAPMEEPSIPIPPWELEADGSMNTLPSAFDQIPPTSPGAFEFDESSPEDPVEQTLGIFLELVTDGDGPPTPKVIAAAQPRPGQAPQPTGGASADPSEDLATSPGMTSFSLPSERPAQAAQAPAPDNTSDDDGAYDYDDLTLSRFMLPDKPAASDLFDEGEEIEQTVIMTVKDLKGRTAREVRNRPAPPPVMMDELTEVAGDGGADDDDEAREITAEVNPLLASSEVPAAPRPGAQRNIAELELDEEDLADEPTDPTRRPAPPRRDP